MHTRQDRPPHVTQVGMGPSKVRQCSLLGGPMKVLLISPQRWDGLRVSKHHYAMELAALGHQIWFVEPPLMSGKAGALSVAPTAVDGITRIIYTPGFPYRLKFHARWLFDRLMAGQARRIAQAIPGGPDIVWDFDNAYQFSDLRAFGPAFSIFHPVDDLIAGQSSDKGCDLLLSVSQGFLDKIAGGQRGHVVKHAISREHERHARRIAEAPQRTRPQGWRPQVGYVGNLEHAGIDWPVIVEIIGRNPQADFHIIGPHSRHGETSAPSNVPLDALCAMSHCVVHGAMPSDRILALAETVDIWLVCYDARKSRDGATNSHKILEYLATGNAVLCNRIAAYEGSDLVEMTAGDDNRDMPRRIGDMLARLDVVNAPEQRRRRALYALSLSYEASLRRIDALCRQG